MNLADARAAHQTMMELRAEVISRLPPTVTEPHWWNEDETLEFELYDVDLDTMTAVYRLYAGRGEYDYHDEPIVLADLFKD